MGSDPRGSITSSELPDNRAVIDRIESGIAVLLVGPAGGRHELDATLLPEGAGDGDVVMVTVEGAAIVAGEIDRKLTDARCADAEQQLARLRKGRSGRRFS